MIGRTVSHYTILEKLGEGGMGVVYKAEDTRLRRTVALKILPREAVADPVAKARLTHEAQAAAALDHSNVCTVYEIGEADGYTFIAMALVEGESLRDRIAVGPLPLDTVLHVARQAGEGLAEAHRRGIVHRDIKPANVMVSENGQVKILDFGLARADWQSRLTKTGTAVGTVAYMAPEQATGGAEADARTDIWSFGVLLYEMISGRLPFRAEHEQAVLYSILNEAPEPLTAIRTGVPVELERIVAKAMAKRPEDRYQHVEDMLVDLNAAGRRILSPQQSATSRSAGATGRKRTRIVAATVVIAVAIIAAVLLSRQILTPGGGTSDLSIRSLAVLPFDNLMNDPEQDYFVEGMHEALITGLSKLGSLRVISRTSVMLFRDSQKPLPEIARELDVDALIEGSVLRVGDEVQITAQLIDGTSDEHLWADSYKRDLRDVLSMINDVAGKIAGEIQATLTPAQTERLANTRPVDPEAYEEVLRGMQMFNTFRISQVQVSLEHFNRAIEIDPGFAQAYAGLSGAYTVLAITGVPPMEVMPKAKAAAQKALELDDGLANAHTSMGYVLLYFDREWEAAGRAFRRALEIDPNDGMARHGYADYLLVLGRLDESVDEVVRGRQSNPLSPMSNAVVVGHLYMARRYDELLEEADKLMAVNPHYPAVQNFVRQTYWQLGKYEKTVELLRSAGWTREPAIREAIDRGYAESGPRGTMLALARLWEARSDTTFVRPTTVALYYAWAGQAEPAMTWLEKAEELRSPTFVHIMLDPAFDALRDTPRFQALLRKLNLSG
jgi:serine/threonine protein kinase/tetratricopeptide (TPR) repeat protein